MDIDHLLSMSCNLQELIVGKKPSDLVGDDRKAYIREQALALTDELHEMLSEVDWKSWSTSATLNRTAYVMELVDVLFFVANLLLIAEPEPGEISARYIEKYNRNVARYTKGPNGENMYNGRTGKCPTCKRDFTDLRVIQGGMLTVFGRNDKTFCSEECANNFPWTASERYSEVPSGQYPG